MEFHPFARAGLAMVALERGDALAAADMGERLLRRLRADDRLMRAVACKVLVRAAVALDDAERAGSLAAELRSIASEADTRPLHAAASFADACVAAARGCDEDARRGFEDAVELYGRSSAPFEAAYARIELSTVLDRLGRHASARREADEAVAVLRAIGASRAAERASAVRDSLVRSRRGPRAGGLTERELEVLRLVSVGRSNGEIAAHLVISEHTVHRHVANIRRKLGVSSRGAAAVRAASDGWL